MTLALLATCLLTLATCNQRQAKKVSGAAAPKVFFPKLEGLQPTPLLVAKGEFFSDDEGCLRLDDEGALGELGFVPLWTPQ